jgi:hypothetical protein
LNFNEVIVSPGKVRAGTRPTPFCWLLNKAGPYRVHFNVSDGSEQMTLIHDKRLEALLP